MGRLRTACFALLLFLFSTLSPAQTISRVSATIVGPTSLTTTTCASVQTTTGCSVLNLGGWSRVGVQLTGTWTGTVTILESCLTACAVDANWIAVSMTPVGTVTPATTTTANGFWQGVVVGQLVRTRFSTASSGTVVVMQIATIS